LLDELNGFGINNINILKIRFFDFPKGIKGWNTWVTLTSAVAAIQAVVGNEVQPAVE
jgi:hypothetical protein